ncbi:MAG: FtsW/RodA/SpoVE family cell cycle protein [Armatimonadota bacterium]|nr:FtsW/RodA/SpoVE family cell cycle protein [Armatimonadota bacterium]
MQQAREDRLLKWSVLALVVVGLIAVYDASFPKSGFEQIRRQVIWAIIGWLAYWLGKRVPLVSLSRYVVWVALPTLLLMLATRFTPYGVQRNGAYRWLKIAQVGTVEITIQPAELGKVVLIALLARLLCHSNLVSACKPIWQRPHSWLWAFFCIFTAAGIVLGCQRDLGTAFMFVSIGMVMFFTAGLPLRWLVALALLVAIGGGIFTYYEHYRWQRVVAFTQPFAYINSSGYQLAHSLMGIGTGGIWGTGLGTGRAKEFLPAAETDFVFTTISEETGVIGSTAVIVLLALVAWRTLLIAYKTEAMFPLLLVSGIGTMIALQSLLNLYVVTGSIPTTGVPLPFISYGGSSLVSLLFSIGLVQKVACTPMIERVKEAPHARVAGGRRNRGTPVSRREYRRGIA